MRVSVSVVENTARQLLMLKRADHIRPGGGLWSFPGGRLDTGETFLAGSRRELREEIGTDHEVELLANAGPFRDTFYGGIYRLHLFHYRWRRGSVQLNGEHTEYAWVGQESYRHYQVMAGVDEDLAYLRLWPISALNHARLPASPRRDRIDPKPRR